MELAAAPIRVFVVALGVALAVVVADEVAVLVWRSLSPSPAGRRWRTSTRQSCSHYGKRLDRQSHCRTTPAPSTSYTRWLGRTSSRSSPSLRTPTPLASGLPPSRATTRTPRRTPTGVRRPRTRCGLLSA